jgi:hypothetical protein
MTTLISHIYNEEFLLPFFIEHHYGKFDNGIILDFGSTDASLRVLQELAPSWQVIDCSGETFGALKLDALVHSIEEKTDGVCLVLTITEFFIGDPRFISAGMVLPSYSLLRTSKDPEIKGGESFHQVYRFGISPFNQVENSNSEWILRMKGRKIKTTKEQYPIGRHFEIFGRTPFLIYRVANCLASNEMIKRRLQIQERVPLGDVKLGFGAQHTNYGRGLDHASLLEVVNAEILISEDVSKEITSALEFESFLNRIQTDSKEFNVLKELISQIEYNQTIMSAFVVRNLGLESDVLSMNEEYQNLETQLKRPSYTFSLLLRTILPAIQIRISRKHN